METLQQSLVSGGWDLIALAALLAFGLWAGLKKRSADRHEEKISRMSREWQRSRENTQAVKNNRKWG